MGSYKYIEMGSGVKFKWPTSINYSNTVKYSTMIIDNIRYIMEYVDVESLDGYLIKLDVTKDIVPKDCIYIVGEERLAWFWMPEDIYNSYIMSKRLNGILDNVDSFEPKNIGDKLLERGIL